MLAIQLPRNSLSLSLSHTITTISLFMTFWPVFSVRGRDDPKTATANDALTALRRQLRVLEDKESLTLQRIEREHVRIRLLVLKSRSAAVVALRRHKALTSSLAHIGRLKETLTTQIDALEAAKLHLGTAAAVQSATAALKMMHEALLGSKGIEGIDKTVDETSDQLALAREITERISGPDVTSTADDVDANLDDELERFMLNDKSTDA
ncbi:hypothetical protein EXIGLDRAFT_337569 [Exidia glandulosa HHB12029]|uniref:Vacuolar-sorting protein SNF7 n=1 Tax=Exidia glandulosa HHB12029 TaxID=1314781 RepID=A0A165LJ16_EXIGL|nr:hypothetical protein EXIGLDRAFT_337569 [Exidia glandulosa HHB12029]